MNACADDPTEADDPAQPAATTAAHPPIYDPELHEYKAIPEPEVTYGQFVVLVYVDNMGLEESDFYAKNPEWVPFKNQKMTSKDILLGVHR